MIKSISFLFFVIFSSAAFAGIIGVGGTNATEDPEMLAAINQARRVEIESDDFRRLSARIGSTGIVNQVLTTTSGEKIRKDFLRVYVDHGSKIIDTNVQVMVQPKP